MPRRGIAFLLPLPEGGARVSNSSRLKNLPGERHLLCWWLGGWEGVGEISIIVVRSRIKSETSSAPSEERHFPLLGKGKPETSITPAQRTMLRTWSGGMFFFPSLARRGWGWFSSARSKVRYSIRPSQ